MVDEKLEVPILLISNGVLLPGSSLKIPVKSRANVNTVEKYLTRTRRGGDAANQHCVAIGYKVAGDKVFEIVTLAFVEQILGWTFNNLVQYSIQVVGLHRAKIEKLTLPTCHVIKLDEPINVNLTHDVIERLKIGAKMLATQSSGGGGGGDNFANDVQQLLDEMNYGKLADICVSQLKYLGYSQLLDYLAINDVEKRVEMCQNWIKAHSSQAIGLKSPTRRPIPNKPKTSLENIEEKLKALDLPENVASRVWSELARLKGLSSSQTEYNVLIGWLELIVDLPWNTSTPDEIDIGKARELLDESHDAMLDVKQRVLEHLAVCQMNGTVQGMILCFTGPPGIGKTSIAKSIAAAMNRNFERVSLGGIRDESDIRGHRRTYVAAMPGRIIEALKHCKSNNPVMLLDEVDKLYSGNHGSPSAALLELLDPEQNSTFHDHYLNVPFDTSKIMFIATANDLSNIEPALRDRLEIIEMSGYSMKEKLKICENHLIPRQLIKHCILPDYVEVDRNAIFVMIEEYTMEAGVRQLERNVGAICRHVALKLASALNTDPGSDVLPEMELPIRITASKVHKILKTKLMKRVRIVEKMRPLPPGTCFGLSVTTNGGRVMPVETSRSPGTGKIVTTGQLGKVLDESILVAKGWLSANADRLKIASLNEWDVHVHLPSGAVNKDGPSAGTAIVATLTSLAMNVPIRGDTAITGEISLTGHVLPVGGIKEKVLAAHREGLRRVVIPKSNLDDYEKLDLDVKNEMNVISVDTIEDVIKAMIEKAEISAKL